MPSHLDTEPDKDKPLWVTQHHIVGNMQADRLASMAAKSAAISDLNISAPVIYYTNLTKRIQARLACIVCNLPSRPKYVKHKIPKPGTPSKDSLISLSSHSLSASGDFLICSICKGRVHTNSRSLKTFLNGECNVVMEDFKPTPVSTTVQIANTKTHPSHKIYSFRGGIFCNVCGCAARARLAGLAKPCLGIRRGPQKSHGQKVKENLARGELPPGMKEWPEDSFEVSRRS